MDVAFSEERFAQSVSYDDVRRGNARIVVTEDGRVYGRMNTAQFFNERLREAYDDLAEAEAAREAWQEEAIRHSRANNFVEQIIASAPEHERSILRQAHRWRTIASGGICEPIHPSFSISDSHSVSFADEFIADACWMCEHRPDETAVGLCMDCLEVVRRRA